MLGCLTEETPAAYKNVTEVIEVVQGAGIGGEVVRLTSMGVLKD